MAHQPPRSMPTVHHGRHDDHHRRRRPFLLPRLTMSSSLAVLGRKRSRVSGIPPSKTTTTAAAATKTTTTTMSPLGKDKSATEDDPSTATTTTTTIPSSVFAGPQCHHHDHCSVHSRQQQGRWMWRLTRMIGAVVLFVFTARTTTNASLFCHGWTLRPNVARHHNYGLDPVVRKMDDRWDPSASKRRYHEPRIGIDWSRMGVTTTSTTLWSTKTDVTRAVETEAHLIARHHPSDHDASSSSSSPARSTITRGKTNHTTATANNGPTTPPLLGEDDSPTMDEEDSSTNQPSSLTDDFWVTPHNPSLNTTSNTTSTTTTTSADTPTPTHNGGFRHTQASRAKISAANKGKQPWNKGVARSPQVKARIAAGVRARNRERFLAKLADLGVTEEAYTAQQRQIRAVQDAERRARRTAKGGYRPTEATKRKISNILKEKYAKGECKPRTVDPSRVRRGFTHTEETRRKISESLKQRWANDPVYREKMAKQSKLTNTSQTVRDKISASLRKKWTDPDFRQQMMTKIQARERSNSSSSNGMVYNEEHRQNISNAMKAKWRDDAYREKTLAALAKRRDARVASRPPAAPRRKRKSAKAKVVTPKATAAAEAPAMVPVTPKPSKGTAPATVQAASTTVPAVPLSSPSPPVATADTVAAAAVPPLVQPMQPRTIPRTKTAKSTSKRKRKTATTATSPKRAKAATASKPKKASDVVKKDISSSSMIDAAVLVEEEEEDAKKAKTNSGSVDLLKEERRDLYDLLYGDEEPSSSSHKKGNSVTADEDEYSDAMGRMMSNQPASVFDRLEDENLDSFDPYGLEDF